MLFNSLWPSDAMVSEALVNTGSGNGLLPDGTKSLPESMLIIGINPCLISQIMCWICWKKLWYKIKFLKIRMHMPEDNEWTH